MKILAIDVSASPASCAITQEGMIVASAAVNTKLTHSQTLLPMVQDMLRNSACDLGSIDVFAVSTGPGSFTGVRIGVAAIKGLAFAGNTPCASVSTLAAMAENMGGLPFEGVICGVMDARCEQVYTACFSLQKGTLCRLTEDAAVTLVQLRESLSGYACPVLLVGDGAVLCYDYLHEQLPCVQLAPPHLRYQQAVGVAAQAQRLAAAGELCAPAELLPRYLRLPQAERELARKTASTCAAVSSFLP